MLNKVKFKNNVLSRLSFFDTITSGDVNESNLDKDTLDLMYKLVKNKDLIVNGIEILEAMGTLPLRDFLIVFNNPKSKKVFSFIKKIGLNQKK